MILLLNRSRSDALPARHKHPLRPYPKPGREGRPTPCKRVGESKVCTRIIVAAELRYGVAQKGSPRLAAALESILAALEVLAFETPADKAYGQIRAHLEKSGRPIGANDLLIASQAVAHGYTLVSDNEHEFSGIEALQHENWLR